MADLAVLAMIQSLLGGSTAREQNLLFNELARRLILSGLAVSPSGVFTFTVPFLNISALTGTLGVLNGGTGLATISANQLVYASALNTIAGLATANSSVLVTSAGGVPSWSTALPAGLTGVGTVTHTAGVLTANALVLGNGAADETVLGSLGTTTTVLHGNAAGAPSYTAVVEADLGLTDVTTANVSVSAHGFVPKAPNTATQVLRGDGAWGVPAIASAQAILGGDVAIVSANTFTDVVSVSLAAGTWVVSAQGAINNTTANAPLLGARISTGSTHFASLEGWSDAANIRPWSFNMTTIIALGITTTIKLQAVSTRGTSENTVKAASLSNGSGNITTQINAIRIL